jgi:hypothetical protein
MNVPKMNDSCSKENVEVHNVVKSDLNLPEGKKQKRHNGHYYHRHLFHSKNICPLLFLTSR